MAKLNKTVIKQLEEIAKSGRVSEAVGKPLLEMGLIQVNVQDVDSNGNAAAILTDKAKEGMPAPKGAEASTAASSIQLISGIVLPESKRGFGRTAQPSKYPFATMDVGVSFFVSNTEVDGDALKKLGSTVSNANNKYRTETGEKRTVTRKKKGGNGEQETVELPVYKADKKFTIRGVKKDQVLGNWKAPEDGAVIQRTL